MSVISCIQSLASPSVLVDVGLRCAFLFSVGFLSTVATSPLRDSTSGGMDGAAESAGLEPELAELIIKSFEGEKDEKGRFDGHGVAHFDGGHSYAGNFAHGMMDGAGKYCWADGTTYEGEFRRNRIEGRGKYTWVDSSTYDGEVAGGLRHGIGMMSGAGGLPVYTGNWKLGKRHGRGTISFDRDRRCVYDGDWVDDMREGEGTMRYGSGNVFTGGWRADRKCGRGEMQWYDRAERYIGAWRDDKQNGQGEHIWLDADAVPPPKPATGVTPPSPEKPPPSPSKGSGGKGGKGGAKTWAGTQRQMSNRYLGQVGAQVATSSRKGMGSLSHDV